MGRFRSSCPGRKAGDQEFSIKNTALEFEMLRNDITISDLCKLTRVSRGTMVSYLRDGKENKAFRELQKRFPKSWF